MHMLLRLLRSSSNPSNSKIKTRVTLGFNFSVVRLMNLLDPQYRVATNKTVYFDEQKETTSHYAIELSPSYRSVVCWNIITGITTNICRHVHFRPDHRILSHLIYSYDHKIPILEQIRQYLVSQRS